MPGFDGAGPQGYGPMTGRGLGRCNPQYGRGYGYGCGFGRGMGRGFGRGFGRGMGRGFRGGYGWGTNAPLPDYAPPAYSSEQETADLRAEAQMLQATLAQINERLAALEANKA